MLFTHNKTPKVFCLTFGVHVKKGSASFLCARLRCGGSYLFEDSVPLRSTSAPPIVICVIATR